MRIKRAVNAVKKRRKIFKLAKGYRGAKSKLYRVSREAVMKSQMYAYVGNAAARMNGLSYSRFMNGLKKSEINLNRKVLADLAVNDAATFTALCEKAKAAL